MATRTTLAISRPGFVVDWQAVERLSGGQIDFALTGAGFIDATTGKKRIKAGTVMGQNATSKKWAPHGTATFTGRYAILQTDANEGAESESLSGYGFFVGGVLYENLLPEAAGGPPAVLPGTRKADLAASGCTFKYEIYADNRAL